MSKSTHLGKIIREKRERCGMSISELAKQTNRSAKCIMNIELGDSDPKFSTVRVIAQVLDINMSELL